MPETAVRETQVLTLHVRRRRLLPWVDVGPFLLFFGVSGEDRGRAARLERRFEQEHFSQRVTLRLQPALPAGRYTLRGLPAEANKRGWTVGPGGHSAHGDLSADGLRELQGWMNQRQLEGAGRGVQAESLLSPSLA
ncbi:hypothetical protein [Deinococcus aerophilus]|uniref:Uncharacterized protein n=1 Tax=Deinococcus aerophilus TaxID=522488 RepID=A0ABQ2GHX2_9DEIO|nr:hypothetical protein [Deinococcus aerophilus]GGL96480.1 hypothetical protein GCM10010841_01110 [Deinococcus aerophilus]